MWMCAVHNSVNERLKKAEFDCTKVSSLICVPLTLMKLVDSAQLEGLYDCGCGDDDTQGQPQPPEQVDAS